MYQCAVCKRQVNGVIPWSQPTVDTVICSRACHNRSLNLCARCDQPMPDPPYRRWNYHQRYCSIECRAEGTNWASCTECNNDLCAPPCDYFFTNSKPLWAYLRDSDDPLPAL